MMRLGVVGLALVLSTAACGPSVARLSGRWVFATPGGIGKAQQPTHGAPLVVTGVGSACASRAALDQQFGKACDQHETEGGAQQGAAPPPLTDEVIPGLQPTPGEVVWYCDANTVARVVLQRCQGTDTFSVSQIALLLAE